MSSQMSLQLKLNLSWVDSQLEFHHLQADPSRNFLTIDDVNNIWMPNLVFTNTKTMKVASFRNASAFVYIKANDGKCKNITMKKQLFHTLVNLLGSKVNYYSRTELHSGTWYFGKDWYYETLTSKAKKYLTTFLSSLITAVEHFTVDFNCQYDLRMYPFDYQECEGKITPDQKSRFFVELVPSSVTYIGSKDLPSYQFKSVRFSDMVNILK